ncbi:MAG: DUF2887 domain-containing protein [Methylococcaceae bacterium]|nr:MAG: DUF2887 domain-containing protein [Methylococcaceae bacterium]
MSPPDGDSLRPTLFAEAQFQPDENFYPRFFSEIFLRLRQQVSPHPWYAVVIYPNRAAERPPPAAFASLLNLPEVRRVYLEDFPRRSTGMLGLVSLIICPPAQAADLSRSLAADDTPPLPTHEWLDLIETILIYKAAASSRNR